MSEQVAIAPSLGPSEARRLTDEVKRDAQALWQKLRQLYEGGAHTALGFSSWHAYCEAEFGFGQSHSYRLLDAGRVAEAIPQLGNEAQARELVPLLRDEGEDAVVAVVRELRAEHGEGLTAERIRQVVDKRLAFERKVKTLTSSESTEWYTPERYVAAVREVLGEIDLDPASCKQANEVVRARMFYDAETDGLTREWRGRVFSNPPYGPLCAPFVAKALEHYAAGQIQAAILLLNAYTTDTKWFQPLWDYLLCFTSSRIHFANPFGKPCRPSTGSVFVYLGPARERFAHVFQRFGAIVERVNLPLISKALDPPQQDEWGNEVAA